MKLPQSAQPGDPREIQPGPSVKLVVAYDGTHFKGWQKGNGRTVQDTLEKALLNALPRASGGAVPPGSYSVEQLHLVGAGRTDAGVHAEGQVASAILPIPVKLDILLSAANEELPPDVAIKNINPAPDRFHARYHAKTRTYRYSILLGPSGDPFRALYAWHIPKELNIDAMRNAAALLEGTQDFTSLTADKSKSNRVRTVHEIRVELQGQHLELFFTADSFLWNQVRIMTMVLVQTGLGSIGIPEIRSLLQARNRALAPEPAPARGLCLFSVSYE